MAHKPRTPSPVAAALDRLARLAAAGSAPDRMVREAQNLIADWRREPDLDASALRERLEEMRDSLSEGVASAEEAVDDVDTSDKAAAKQAQGSLKALQAVRDAVASEAG